LTRSTPRCIPTDMDPKDLKSQLAIQKKHLQDSLESLLSVSTKNQVQLASISDEGNDQQTHDHPTPMHVPTNPMKFRLDLSKCFDEQSQNETIDCYQSNEILDGQIESESDPAEFRGATETELMMNFHKDILYAEFRELLQNHPNGGPVSVDSIKLRILLDLMHQHTCRLERHIQSFQRTSSLSFTYDASSSGSNSSETLSHRGPDDCQNDSE
jgi:hypothetical protein